MTISKTHAIPFLVLIVIVSLLCVQCSTRNHRRPEKAAIIPPKSELDLQEEAVYSAVLNDASVHEGTNRLVVEDDTTLRALEAERVREVMAFVRRSNGFEIDPRMVEDLLGKNSVPGKLTGRLNLNVNVVMLSKEELAALGKSSDFWQEFFARYPDQSLITLSRVGFSDDRRSALVVTGKQGGRLSGGGMYVILTWEGGHWTIKHKFGAGTS